MKIRKAKGIQHSVEGYVCACLMSGCSCSSYCGECSCWAIPDLSIATSISLDVTNNNNAQQSSTNSVQNGLER